MDFKTTDTLLARFKQSLRSFNNGQFAVSTRTQLFIFSFLINLLVIPLGIASPNEGSRYLLTKTIVENNSFSWPASWLNNYQGFWYFPDFGVNQGFISDKAPGLSFFLVPFFIIAKILYGLVQGSALQHSSFYTNFDAFVIYVLKVMLVVVAALTAVRLYDLLQLLGSTKKTNLGIVLISSFGTVFFLYTPSFFPSLLSAFLYVSIIYHLVYYTKTRKTSDLFIAGLLSGFSVVVEYGSLLMIPWFLWYLFSYDLLFNKKINLKELILYSVPVIIGMLPLFAYDFVLSGNPFQTSYYFSHWISQIHFYNNIFDGFSILLIDPTKGLFVLSPILFLACIGFANPSYYKNHIREILLIIMPCIAFMVFYAKNFDPTGGTDVGPRYIIALIPLIAIGLQGWFLIQNKFTFMVNTIILFLSFRNAILLVLGIGVFPESMTQNPVFSLAIPNFLANNFNPVLLKQDQLLFVTILGLLVLTGMVLNYDQAILLKKWLFSSQNGTSTPSPTPTESQEVTNELLLSSGQLTKLVLVTVWLFNIFLILFLMVGIQYLSKGYYPNITFNSKSDFALIQILVILTTLWSLKVYTSFNVKQFIKGE